MPLVHAGQLERLDGLEKQKVAVGGTQAAENEHIEPVQSRVILRRGQLRADQRERLQQEADAVGLAERSPHERIAHEARAPHHPALRQRQRACSNIATVSAWQVHQTRYTLDRGSVTVEADKLVREVRVVGVAQDGRQHGVRCEEAEHARERGPGRVGREELVQLSPHRCGHRGS